MDHPKDRQTNYTQKEVEALKNHVKTLICNTCKICDTTTFSQARN